MDMSEILQATEQLKNIFKCSKCAGTCDGPHRLIYCGHMYCKDCITLIEDCVTCGAKFTSKDVHLDQTSSVIISSIESITHALQAKTSLRKTANNNSSCDVIMNDEYPSNNFMESDLCHHKEELNLNCDCSNYNVYDKIDTKVKEKVDKKDLTNKRNAVGETKLHRACKKGNEKEVEELLDLGASVNVQDYAGWTPLHEAVIVGNTQIVERLLEKGSVVNAPGDYYDTPLHKAVAQKHTTITELLLKQGADIYSKNYEGVTPWDLADSDLKFTLNTVKATKERSPESLTIQQYIIFLIGNSDELKPIVEKFLKFSDVQIVSALNETVTHVVVDSKSKLIAPSYELLLSIVYMKPVVTSEWLHSCVSQGRIVDYTEYFVIGTEDFQNDVVSRAQINKYKLNPNLFNGCYFYLTKLTGTYDINGVILNKEKISKLLTVGGGTMLKREPHLPAISQIKLYPWHAPESSSIEQCCHYIIYDPAMEPELKYNMKELRHLPYQWIYESILQYKLVPPELMECRQ